MDHATCAALLSATYFATSLLPLTVRLIPVIVEVGRLIVRFRRAEPTPQLCHRFETQLSDQLRELGRLIVEWTFNHIEPHDRADMPKQMCFEGIWYRRRSKTPNRKVATLFGTITVWRMLYQPLHGVEPIDLSLGDPLGTRSRFVYASLDRAGGSSGDGDQPERGVSHARTRSRRLLVGRDLAQGDCRGGHEYGTTPP